MLKDCDVLLVGAATTGIYFSWLMAKKGHSVLVIDKEEREQVGQRLEVIHLDKETFKELNVPPPTEEPELIGSWRGINSNEFVIKTKTHLFLNTINEESNLHIMSDYEKEKKAKQINY